MLSHYVQYTHAYLVACSNMRALLHAYLMVLDALDRFFLSLRLHAPPFLYVRSDTTMDPMCVRAANALMRLCICPGSSELLMFA